MPRKAAELTAIEVKRLTAPGLHFVGGVAGLGLQVLPTGGRTWVLRVMIGGKRREMGLGGFPDVKLTDARDAARDAREKIRKGIDPIAEGRAARAALAAQQAGGITFKEATARYIESHGPKWRSEKYRLQWQAAMTKHVHPKLGALAVRDIELPHILSVLEPIWPTRQVTANNLRGRIEQVLDWATTRGYRRGPNPARWRGHLDKLLPARKHTAVKERKAVSIGDAGEFMKRLRALEGPAAAALELIVLTAARSGEVCGAAWSEIDLHNGVWTIPKERMKTGQEHRVPLSPAAVTLLKAQPRFAGWPLVFQAMKGGPISDKHVWEIMRELEPEAVPHGWRSTFRDWAAERTSYPHEVCEMALAHTITNKTEAAYRRGDLFEKRRRLMNDWADFLSVVEVKGDNVTPIRGAR
jgi:integrase